MGAKPITIENGTRFGRLVVLGPAGHGPQGHTLSRCRCDCGKETVVYNSKLVSGHTRSCGCLMVDTSKTLNLQHGESYTRLHVVWAQMKSRCFNTANHAYCRYGGRGITVCKSWATSYRTFAKWAKAHGYRDDLTIDRIDNDKGYYPSNCRFVDYKAQNRNRRSSRFIEWNGVRRTLAEWSERTGINATTIATRIDRQGWDVELALTVPAVRKGTANG